MDAIITSYITAFLLGLFSTVHCIAMCGSVIGALTLSLPADIRESQRRMLPYVFNYNIGRISSYAIAGLIVGLLTTPFASLNLHWPLQVLSAVIMVAMGLYLAGWFPRFAKIERIGTPVWRWLQPLGQRFLPVRKKSHAFYLGMVWGWLPCGLVYAALAVAASAGDPVKGSLVMLAFGAGTLPAVMGAGLFAGMLASLARSKGLRRTAGVLIIFMAFATLFWPMDHHDHHPATADHSHHHDSEPAQTDDEPGDSMHHHHDHNRMQDNERTMPEPHHDHESMMETPEDSLHDHSHH